VDLSEHSDSPSSSPHGSNFLGTSESRNITRNTLSRVVILHSSAREALYLCAV
jgi:hypothetical protein